MILGIGTDIVYIQRVRESLAKHGDSFAQRILTEKEFKIFKSKNESIQAAFLAKRFAAKEATAKAMGTGFSQGLSLRHIGVENDEAGKPSLYYLESAKKFVAENKVTQSHISLSDEKEYAVAYVILVTMMVT
ncbi:MAG: holo-ACP synthase [Woeseiaceae bacterium]